MTTEGHVLLVEDDKFLRRACEASLRQRGFTVVTATDGEAGLRLARSEPRPEVILLDLLMPRADGFTFLRERQTHPHLARIPVIVLSAGGLDALREASQLRATAVLAKPLNLDVLSSVIDHVLEQWAREASATTVV